MVNIHFSQVEKQFYTGKNTLLMVEIAFSILVAMPMLNFIFSVSPLHIARLLYLFVDALKTAEPVLLFYSHRW